MALPFALAAAAALPASVSMAARKAQDVHGSDAWPNCATPRCSRSLRAWRSSLPTHFDCNAAGLTTTAKAAAQLARIDPAFLAVIGEGGAEVAHERVVR